MPTIQEAISLRHSVRQYKTTPIAPEIRRQLDDFVKDCNEESGLHIWIRYDDPQGFDSRMAHYGSFRNVQNYIVLAGEKTDEFDFDVRCGYYGEKVVLFVQTLGLNTCWTAMSFNKKKVRELISEGEALCMVIALGYGETQGHPHKGKRIEQVAKGDFPEWFKEGVTSALLAPTAINQQKFEFGMENEKPYVRVKGIGPCTKVDLGIAAYHFDVITGRKVEIKR